MKEREFIYIDIPYVTESMFVKIEGSKNLKVRGVPNSVHVEATSYFLQHTDHGETENEKSNLSKWEDEASIASPRNAFEHRERGAGDSSGDSMWFITTS